MMRILVSGATGLIGRALVRSLESDGHRVVRLVRERPDPARGDLAWDVSAGILGIEALGALDAVVHLAGESIAQRWTLSSRRAIRDSRVKGTALLAEILSLLPQKPRVFVSASAVGFYGNRGDEELDESSAPGSGFLTDVCREWETATGKAREAGIRTVHLRTGIVLSAKGGTLSKMLTPFRFGLGGPIGSGRQWMSWISLSDEVAAIRFAIENETLQGPVNLTAPQPVTNRGFARALGHALHRPAFLPLTGFVVKILFGEMGQALLLEGQKVMPRKLSAAGFQYRYPDLESALRFELGG